MTDATPKQVLAAAVRAQLALRYARLDDKLALCPGCEQPLLARDSWKYRASNQSSRYIMLACLVCRWLWIAWFTQYVSVDNDVTFWWKYQPHYCNDPRFPYLRAAVTAQEVLAWQATQIEGGPDGS